MHLNSFDYFRGIAIIYIVAGHSYAAWGIDTFYEQVIANLITGGSTLFVFISGFFFHHVFYPKFQYKNFILKKTKYVLLPYTLLSILGILIIVFFLEDPPYMTRLIGHEAQNIGDYIILSIKYLWTGRILPAYWYIPFIMIMFFMSPLFIKQIQLPTRLQVILFFSLLCISLLIHRPSGNLSPLHSVIYFTPIYMLGIICSINKDKILSFIDGKSTILGLLVVFTSTIQILIYDTHRNFLKEKIFSLNGIDIIIIQKILLCFFLLSVLHKLENKNIPILKLLASTSFAIYFIHPWVLYFLDRFTILDYLTFLPGPTVLIMTTTLLLSISATLAVAIKYIFRKNSRFIIGW